MKLNALGLQSLERIIAINFQKSLRHMGWNKISIWKEHYLFRDPFKPDQIIMSAYAA